MFDGELVHEDLTSLQVWWGKNLTPEGSITSALPTRLWASQHWHFWPGNSEFVNEVPIIHVPGTLYPGPTPLH